MDFPTPFPSRMPSPRSEWNRFHFRMGFAFRNRSLHFEMYFCIPTDPTGPPGGGGLVAFLN
jgi:hypothetical protein